MNTTKKTPLMLALPLALVGLTVSAGTAEAGPRHRGGDRVRSEVPFRHLDMNRDGVVTRRELKRFHRTEARATARRLDRNDDGFVSRREYRKARNRGFARADFNRDGFVTRAEERLARKAQRWGVPTRAFRELSRHQVEKSLRMWDRDGDGVIARNEMRPQRRMSRRNRYPAYAYNNGARR